MNVTSVASGKSCPWKYRKRQVHNAFPLLLVLCLGAVLVASTALATTGTGFVYGVNSATSLTYDQVAAGDTVSAIATERTLYGNSFAYAYGFYVNGNLTVSNGLLGAVNASATASSSTGTATAYGLYSTTGLTINNGFSGQLFSTASSAGNSATGYGLFSFNGPVTIDGFSGILTTSSTTLSTSASNMATGVGSLYKAVTINNGLSGRITTTATGGGSLLSAALGLYSGLSSVNVNGGISGTIESTATTSGVTGTSAAGIAAGAITLNDGISGAITATANNTSTGTALAYGIDNSGITATIGSNNISTYSYGSPLQINGGISGAITATANTKGPLATAYGIYHYGGTYTLNGSNVVFHYDTPLTLTGGVSGTITASATTTGTSETTTYGYTVSPTATAAGIYSYGPLVLSGGVSGTISATASAGIDGNATAFGLYAYSAMNGGDAATPLSISGTVSATANGTAVAVAADGALNLTVTGTLSGVDTTGGGNGYAIKSAEADDTVTLGTGANLIGKVDLGQGSNTLALVGSGSSANQFLNVTSLVVGDGTAVTNWTLHPTAAAAGVFGSATVNRNASLSLNENATVAGNIVDNGSLTFDVASSLTYGGVISGTGTLTKAGAGSLTLTGVNTYSGGTTISGGTLNVASIENLGSGAITYAGGTLLINGVDALQVGFSVSTGGLTLDTASSNETVAGSYSGTGTITKSGTGTLTLTGDSSTYTGTMQVTTGKVQVAAGASVGGTIDVGTQGELGGHGSVGNVNNSGTVSPGGSIGTLTVAGNYVQSATAVDSQEITTGGVGDLIDVLGTATLNGGTLSVQATPSFYATGSTWTVLSATGGLTGTFSSVTQNLVSPTLRFLPVYTDNAVLLTAARIPYSAYAVTGASASVGTGLYKASYVATGDMASLLTLLDYSPAAVTTSTLQMLSPEPYDAFTQSLFDGGRLLTAAQRAALGEGNVAGSQAFAGPLETGPASLMAVNGHGGGQVNLGAASGVGSSADGATTLPDSRFSVFLRPFGMLAQQQAHSEQSGYNTTTGGLTGGLAFRPVSGLTVALAPAFMSQYVSLKSLGGGYGTVSDWSLALLGAYRHNDWYLDGLFRLGYDTTIAHRNIPVATMSRTARAMWNSWNTNASLGGGYDFHVGAVTLGPIASVEWSTLSQQRYHESRAGGLGLRVGPRTDSSLTTTLGGRVARKFETKFGAVTPEVRAAWGAQWLDSPRSITASFCGTPASAFTTKTAGHGYHSAIIDAGVTADLGKSFSASARVGVELFRPGYDSQAASVSLKYSF